MLDVVQCEGVDVRVWREERRGSNKLPQGLGRRRCRERCRVLPLWYAIIAVAVMVVQE
jgi:hypothetical protein